MSVALGMVEVYGLVAAFAACDAGCKAAEVTVAPFDKNKPADPKGLPVPLQVLVKFIGSVENVSAAVDAAAAEAARITGVVQKRVIASCDESLDMMIRLNAFDKN